MFKRKKIQTETLGEYLVSCRNRLGLSLDEAARAARIQPKYLQALEQGEYQQLPAPVYVQGFLKSLAQVYKINPGRLVAECREETALVENIQSIEKSVGPKRTTMPRFILSPKTITLFGLVLFGTGSLLYLYFQVNSLVSPPVLEVLSPAADGNVNTSLLLVRGKTEAGASVFLNNQEIVVDATGNFLENLSLGAGTNELVIRAVNKFGRETEVVRQIVLVEKAIAGSSTINDDQQRPLELEVKIGPGASWIYLEADGAEDFSGTMLAGSSRKVSAEESVSITTGNAGSTRLIKNGQDLGLLGKEGEVIRDIEFTK